MLNMEDNEEDFLNQEIQAEGNQGVLEYSKTQKDLAQNALNLSLKIFGNAKKHKNSNAQNEAARVISSCEPEVVAEIKKLLAPSMSYNGDMVNNMLFLRYASLDNREKRAYAMRQFMQTAHASFVMSPPERMYLNQLITRGKCDDRAEYFLKQTILYELFSLKTQGVIKQNDYIWMKSEIQSDVINTSKAKEERTLLSSVVRTTEVKIKMIEKIQRGIMSCSSLTRTAFTKDSHLKHHGKNFRLFANIIADMVENSGKPEKNESQEIGGLE
jgi:hypothetical protein